ncbi:uncharacterized protein V1510DRAFT_363706 [Dipodascopsis tothii]|uniref:uncharacterized protein n=1 Tax=Dipodascopsis tothii TaxID=44089 RepID=UPI0034D002AC
MSRSHIDRYVPKAGRDGDYYVPSHRADSFPRESKPRVRYQDPRTLQFQVPFQQFCDWCAGQDGQPASKDELRERYEDYKWDLYARLARGFVVQHMNEEWFKEKYDPETMARYRATIVEYKKKSFHEFWTDFEHGALDEFSMDFNTGAPSKKKVLHIKTIAPIISRAQLEALARDIPGFEFISLSDPNPMKKFHRIGWVILAADGDLAAGVERLEAQKIHDEQLGDFVMHVGVHNMQKPARRKLLYDVFSSPESIQKDLELTYEVALKFEREFGDAAMTGAVDRVRERARALATRAVEQTIASEEAEDADQDEEGMVAEDTTETRLSAAVARKQLDLTVEYLRRAFSFCYYCVCCSDSYYELTKKCVAGHLRRPARADSAKPDARMQNWVRSWSERLNLLLHPEAANLGRLGGQRVEDTVQNAVAGHVKQEDEGKFRCKVGTCTKLFKGEEFVRKHIEKRHKDWLDRLVHEARLVNNYVLDPCRVLPPKTDGQLPLADADAFVQPALTVAGLPLVYPQAVAQAYGAHRVPPIGYFPADPYAYGLNDASESKFAGKAGRQPRDWDRGRRASYRSRSPPRRDFRRDYRDRRDSRDDKDRYRDRERERADSDPRGRALRSYRDLDAPSNSTPELDY